MNATAKRVLQVVFGNRRFATPPGEYVGTDSVLRLGPVDYVAFLSDIAGGGHIAGYGVAQGPPATIAYMPQGVDMVGGGMTAGYGAQPGQLMNPAALPPTSPLSTGI